MAFYNETRETAKAILDGSLEVANDKTGAINIFQGEPATITPAKAIKEIYSNYVTEEVKKTHL